MIHLRLFGRILFLSVMSVLSVKSGAQEDTIRVMSYNVLHYGDFCQGSPEVMTHYLKTIVAFAKPDLLGLVKMQSLKINPADSTGISPFGFADSILKFALNADSPNKFACCPLTNTTAINDMSLLFYNKSRFTFSGITTLCTNLTDFNLYKFYYNDPKLSRTRDTTFLYVVLNHTKSGVSSSVRDQQISCTIQALRDKFYHWPNLIDMGDFNLHNSSEPGYQEAVAPADTNYTFFDPPFFPDQKLAYPLDWDAHPALCFSYLTTSTRQTDSLPNRCGTSGGAKSWFDHILLSSWIIHGTNYIRYIPGSCKTLGNDGHRLNISVNDSTSCGLNTSAPSNVINALFQFSNKYPVLLELGITPNKTGKSPADPDLPRTRH
jgi:hypothetical protein